MKWALRVFVIGFLVLGVVLYFFHPLAPLFLLLSLLVQAPIVWVVSRVNFNSSYLERAAKRREQYEKDGDAAAWLAGEEAEARSEGYKYWSSRGQAACALNRADALCALMREEEARALLAQIPRDKLQQAHRPRYDALKQKLEP